jgi:hypothetical protein
MMSVRSLPVCDPESRIRKDRSGFLSRVDAPCSAFSYMLMFLHVPHLKRKGLKIQQDFLWRHFFSVTVFFVCILTTKAAIIATRHPRPDFKDRHDPS